MTAARRVLLFLANGYILVFFSELAFWGSYDPVGMAPAQFLLTWLGYSVLAHIFLVVVERFRVSTIWSVFLAGSVYGWIAEGVLAQTLYGTPEFPFPITVSWTGLAWHALISVLVGWFLVRRTLRGNDWRKMARLACLIGAGYGLWASTWAFEPGHRVMALVGQGRKDEALVHFALYAVLTSLMLIGSYWVAAQTTSPVLRPGRLERWLLTALGVAYFGLVTLPQRPMAGLVLPPLLALSYVALRRCRTAASGPDLLSTLGGHVSVANYACLLFIPAVAVLGYGAALASGGVLPVNLAIFGVSTIAGATMFVVSFTKALRTRRTESGPA